MLLGLLGRHLGARLAGERRARAGADVASRPLRVLMVSGSYPPMHCGVGDYTARLSDALRKCPDIELQVLTTAFDDAVTAPPFVHRRIERWRSRGLAPYREMLQNFRPDVVHIQYPAQGYRNWSAAAALSSIARRTSGARIVQTWHEYPQPLAAPPGWALLAMGATADALIYVRPDYESHVHGPLRRMVASIPRRFVPNGPAVPPVLLTVGEREQMKRELAVGERRLIAHFGFAYPHKGVHLLFDIADAARDHIVLVGELRQSDAYHARLLELARSKAWQGHVTVCGFVAPERAARILAAADAAVFPFEGGGGIWNSSVHAAMAQGTFVLLTSRERSGYVAEENAYYAPPNALAELRSALADYAGRRNAVAAHVPEWDAIAERHAELYREALRPSS